MYKPRTNNNPNRPIAVPVIFMEAPTRECEDEIFNILETLPFEKIGYVVTMPTCYMNDSDKKDDIKRVTTIGWVKRYNYRDKELLINIYPNVRDIVNNIKNPGIEVRFKANDDGSLNTITKLVIIDMDNYDELVELGEDE